MEPLALATTYATIVSLIGQFKAGRQSASTEVTASEFNDFLLWLTETNHEDLRALLSENLQAAEGIKSILANDKEELLVKLQAINGALSQIASSIEGFRQLATGLNTSEELSDQAKSIIQQLVSSGGSTLLKLATVSTQPIYQIIDGKGGTIEYHEPQFIEDDITTLSDLGLLHTDYNSQGKPLYRLTRTAAKLASTWSSRET